VRFRTAPFRVLSPTGLLVAIAESFQIKKSGEPQRRKPGTGSGLGLEAAQRKINPNGAEGVNSVERAFGGASTEMDMAAK
jgi:hypothetical protein